MMKNKKVLTLAALAGLTLGGLSVAGAASAQGYGEQDAETTVDESGIVLAQDVDESETDGTDTDDAETDGTDNDGAETDGENEGRKGHRGGCNLDTAAEAIGIDEADLKAAIESGDTIADVAEANGVDADTVIDAMVDAKSERIAEKVEAGRITQDEADEKLADVETRIANRVNGVEDASEV